MSQKNCFSRDLKFYQPAVKSAISVSCARSYFITAEVCVKIRGVHYPNELRSLTPRWLLLPSRPSPCASSPISPVSDPFTDREFSKKCKSKSIFPYFEIKEYLKLIQNHTCNWLLKLLKQANRKSSFSFFFPCQFIAGDCLCVLGLLLVKMGVSEQSGGEGAGG